MVTSQRLAAWTCCCCDNWSAAILSQSSPLSGPHTSVSISRPLVQLLSDSMWPFSLLTMQSFRETGVLSSWLLSHSASSLGDWPDLASSWLYPCLPLSPTSELLTVTWSATASGQLQPFLVQLSHHCSYLTIWSHFTLNQICQPLTLATGRHTETHLLPIQSHYTGNKLYVEESITR